MPPRAEIEPVPKCLFRAAKTSRFLPALGNGPLLRTIIDPLARGGATSCAPRASNQYVSRKLQPIAKSLTGPLPGFVIIGNYKEIKPDGDHYHP